jgi:hypothetical protein
MLKARFGRGFGHEVRQTTKWKNEFLAVKWVASEWIPGKCAFDTLKGQVTLLFSAASSPTLTSIYFKYYRYWWLLLGGVKWPGCEIEHWRPASAEGLVLN